MIMSLSDSDTMVTVKLIKIRRLVYLKLEHGTYIIIEQYY